MINNLDDGIPNGPIVLGRYLLSAYLPDVMSIFACGGEAEDDKSDYKSLFTQSLNQLDVRNLFFPERCEQLDLLQPPSQRQWVPLPSNMTNKRREWSAESCKVIRV